jgi:formylmethanofuran dehydrogenase subunit C
MSAFCLTLRAPAPARLDLSALLPERLTSLSEAEIAALPLGEGLVCGDLFRIRRGDEPSLVLEGTDERCDRIGAGMTAGEIRCEGEAGAELGRHMRGGRLLVAGGAGPFAASGLRGGEIVIAGRAGEGLGAPRMGESEGMAGGLVIVRGGAGARAGDRMRRGVLVIEGECGDFAASRMIAGTLILTGRAGRLPGYLMRRGTLIAPALDLPPTFVETGESSSVFRALLARHLAPLSPAAAALLARPRLRRFMGDLAALGLGEALLAA